MEGGWHHWSVHHWEQRGGSCWDFESQGLWYMPFFVCHVSAPSKMCIWTQIMFALGLSQTKMIYIQSVGVLCKNAHTATTCLTSAPHSLKMLWDAALFITHGLNVPWWILCLELMWSTWVQHSLLFSHLLLWVCIPPSEPPSPIRSSADSSFPCADTPHARGAFPAWLQVSYDCVTTGKRITKNTSHFLCIPVEVCIPPFE